MRRTEQTELTVLCLVCQDNKILLQNRKKEDWPGYTLPGGHIEKGESIVDAVIREMKEETGLTIRNPKLCGVKQFPIPEGRYVVFLFRTEEFKGQVVSSEEGEVEWVDRKELEDYPLAEDFMELLQVMEAQELTEFQYIVEGEEWHIRVR